MAGNKDQKGTGKHGHKDTQEPWPHTKEGGQHGRASEAGRSGGQHQQGAGGGHQDMQREQPGRTEQHKGQRE